MQFFILFSETLIISQTKSWVSQNNRKVKKRVWVNRRESWDNAKTFEFGHKKKIGKETPGIISYGDFWKPGQLSFKHTKQFPEILFCLGAGAKNTKNGDFSALPRNCG